MRDMHEFKEHILYRDCLGKSRNNQPRNYCIENRFTTRVPELKGKLILVLIKANIFQMMKRSYRQRLNKYVCQRDRVKKRLRIKMNHLWQLSQLQMIFKACSEKNHFYEPTLLSVHNGDSSEAQSIVKFYDLELLRYYSFDGLGG